MSKKTNSRTGFRNPSWVPRQPASRRLSKRVLEEGWQRAKTASNFGATFAEIAGRAARHENSESKLTTSNKRLF